MILLYSICRGDAYPMRCQASHGAGSASPLLEARHWLIKRAGLKTGPYELFKLSKIVDVVNFSLLIGIFTSME